MTANASQKLTDKITFPKADSQNRLPVSVFIVTFNEEDKIVDCLESVTFCDEIIVVDSFSTDNTVKIAESYGAKVIQRAWPGYKEQKAFGLEASTNEWVINLDADERINPELKEEILKVLTEAKAAEEAGKDFDANGYELSRVVNYLDRWWRKGGWYPEYRVRLLRKSKTVWGGTNPHERPVVSGKIKRLNGELSHYTYDNIADQIHRLYAHASVAAQQAILKGRKPTLGMLIVKPFVRFFKFYFLKKGYREGVAGFIVAVFEAYYTFLKYSLVWEDHLKKKAKK